MSSSSSASVQVSGLSPTTTQESLSHFFTFCGTVVSVDRNEKSATITFAKPSAATTALMLDGGSLDGATIQVKRLDKEETATGTTTTTSHAPNEKEGGAEHAGHTESDDIHQEDKPRSAIVAELLAHGYLVGDKVVSAAIALDHQQGISQTFVSLFDKIDKKFSVQQKATSAHTQANTRAAQLDEKIGVTPKLMSWCAIGRDYYEKALASSRGAQVREFYVQTAKQAADVHAEARRIAEERAGHALFQKASTSSATTTTTTTGPDTTTTTSAPPSTSAQ